MTAEPCIALWLGQRVSGDVAVPFATWVLHDLVYKLAGMSCQHQFNHDQQHTFNQQPFISLPSYSQHQLQDAIHSCLARCTSRPHPSRGCSELPGKMKLVPIETMIAHSLTLYRASSSPAPTMRVSAASSTLLAATASTLPLPCMTPWCKICLPEHSRLFHQLTIPTGRTTFILSRSLLERDVNSSSKSDTQPVGNDLNFRH